MHNFKPRSFKLGDHTHTYLADSKLELVGTQSRDDLVGLAIAILSLRTDRDIDIDIDIDNKWAKVKDR